MTRRPFFVGHAAVVSSLTFLSRLLGLVRDAVIAACFGMNAVTDAFWIGFVVPNLFRRLFGEGALTAAFIPVYSELLDQDRVLARRFVWMGVSLLVVVLATVTLLGEWLLAGLLYYEVGGQDSSMAIRLTMFMLPYAPMICAVALLGGVLQVHHRFGPPAAAPVVLNLAVIASSIFAVTGYGQQDQPRSAIWIVAGGVLVAGVLQLAWIVVVTARQVPVTMRFAGTIGPLRSVVATMGPMALGLAVFQINTLLDSLLAWGLSAKDGGEQAFVLGGCWIEYPMRAGAVTGLQFAQRLYQFPLGVFGIAIATAIFPALSRAAAGMTLNRHTGDPPHSSEEDPVFGDILRQGLRLTVFIGLPASVGLILVRVPMARLIFERYEFSTQDAQRVSVILAGYASAVWAYSLTHVVTRAFHAVKDATTPLRISLWMVGANFLLNLTLVWPLGAAGLAWSTAICAMAQVVALLIAARRLVAVPIDAGVWRSWRQSLGLTLLMAAILWPIAVVFDAHQLSRTACVGLLVGMVLLGVTVVFGMARFFSAEELRWLTQRKVS